MGTDIHLVLEVQDSKTNKWYRPEWDKTKSKYYSTPASIVGDVLSDRNYSLFFALNGVRYWRLDEEAPVPLWPDRGLPSDMDDGTERYHDTYIMTTQPVTYDLGYHNFTYFDAFEWRQANDVGRLKPILEASPLFYYYVTGLFGDKYSNSFAQRWQGIQNMRILVGYDS